jgi:hypothetical protein
VRRRHFYRDADEADAVAEILRDHFGFAVRVIVSTVERGADEAEVVIVDEPDRDDDDFDPPIDSRWDRESDDRDLMRGRHSVHFDDF